MSTIALALIDYPAFAASVRLLLLHLISTSFPPILSNANISLASAALSSSLFQIVCDHLPFYRSVLRIASSPIIMSVPAPPANLNKAHDSAVAASTAAELSGDQQQQQQPAPTTTTTAAAGPSSTASLSASFEPPFPASTSFPTWSFVIEFCDRCRWLHRATWNQTELFQTFGPKGPSSSSPSTSGDAEGVRSITLLPMTEEATAGRYRVWVYGGAREPVCVWDRKTMGGFPELKELVS